MNESNFKKTIILASQSPRRAEILKNAGYRFVSFPVSISEIPNKNLSLDEQIIDIARRKAEASLEKLLDESLNFPDFDLESGVIIASDTMVCLDNLAIGKPENENGAFQTLKKLSAKEHFVKTALYMINIKDHKHVSHIETSSVFFKTLNDEDIWTYIKTGEPLDKAGSYAIQGLGSKFVEHFEGDYQNIVGLPLKSLEKIFSQQNWIFDRQHLLFDIQKTLKPHQNILAVSKLQPLEKIMQLHELGQNHFGENYIQEALKKIEQTNHTHHIQWHLIGPIQKNKVKYLQDHFAYIHSVDSFELAKLISEKAENIKYKQKIFIQVNLSEEASKSGFSEKNLITHWPTLLSLTGIQIVGLMTMPPLQNEAEQNRIYFKRLRLLAEQFSLIQLSMGTSHDYQVALEEGATWIRLGTVLFGDREKIK
jgi:MAF protein